MGCQVLGSVLLCGPHLLGPRQGLGWTHCPLLLSWLMSGRRGEWGVAFLFIGLLPATGVVVGSGLGAVQVEQVLAGFR